MENIYLRYISLPSTVKGLTVKDEAGNYNIYLNTRLTRESNQQTLQHEIQHIANNDFQRLSHIILHSIELGELPVINTSGLSMQKNEQVHWQRPSN